MASFSLFTLLSFPFLCLVFNLCHAQSPSSKPFSLVLPVTKDVETLQYLTTLSYGTPLVPTKLVLDLQGPLLWLDCASRNTQSSSLSTIPHRSIQCLTAKSHEIQTQSWLSTLEIPQDQDLPCQILSENRITGTRDIQGKLVQDLLDLQELTGSKMEPFDQLLFTCSSNPLLNGLASGARGMVGLGRSRSSFTSQVFDFFSTQRKITLCLSSSSGVVQFGNMDYESQPGADLLRSLTFTPLLTNENKKNPSQGYSINVNSIKIGGRSEQFSH